MRKGQYLERAVAFAGDGGALEGLYHRGAKDPPVLILPQHPLQGGSMETTVIAELAWAVTRSGHSSFRFNYRGVGASAGEFGDLDGAVADARRAREHLALTRDPERASSVDIALVGVGLGASVALRLVRECPGRSPLLVLIGPDHQDLSREIAALSCEILMVVPEAEVAERRRALQTLAESHPKARLAAIPGADRAFVRGLVELGKVVAEALEPPGLIDLG